MLSRLHPLVLRTYARWRGSRNAHWGRLLQQLGPQHMIAKPPVRLFWGGSTPNVPAVQQQQTAVAPIDFDVAMKIEGHESQLVSVELLPGQAVRAEPGSLVYMTDGVEMETITGAGVMAGLKRLLTSGTFFLTDFKYTKPTGKGLVALSAEFPSKILRVSLEDYGGVLICQKGAFLCGSQTIQIEMELVRTFAAGFFGGEGFVLQRLMGEGDAFVKAGGALIRRNLRDGEVLRVSSGAVVAFAPTVAYDIQMIKGFKNVVFGSEGLFITTLTGPGMVFLQSLPFDRMVDQIARRIPSSGGGMPIIIPGGGGGGGGGSGGESSSVPVAEGGQITSEDDSPGNPYKADSVAGGAAAAAMGSDTSGVFGKPFSEDENAASTATGEDFKEEKLFVEEPFDDSQGQGEDVMAEEAFDATQETSEDTEDGGPSVGSRNSNARVATKLAKSVFKNIFGFGGSDDDDDDD